MRRAIASITLVAAAAVARAEDESGRASVEVTAKRTTVYAGEPVRLSIGISYDTEFFRENAVPLFSRKTDVPLRVEAPWLRTVPGMDPLAVAEPDGRTATIAVGDDVERAQRDDLLRWEGRPFTSLGVARAFVAREPGEVTLEAPVLRFAYATRFEDDFVNGRRGVDRHDVVVRGEPLALRVLPVPADGRTQSFGGAVGRSLSMQADVSHREVTAGVTFRLTLRFEGEGHLANFDAPRLDGLEGFHVYGVLDDHGASVRTIAYDIAALDASVRELPPIEWSYFDTSDPPSYRVLKTTPIPLTVRPSAAPAGSGNPPPPDEGASTWIWSALAFAVTAFVAAIAWIATRRGRDVAPDAAHARRVAAAEAVHAAAAQGGDAGAAFTEYLAARLACAPAAVVGPDLAGRLASAGVPDALAGRAASAHEALVASRYGGSGAPTAGELAAVTTAIESTTHVV